MAKLYVCADRYVSVLYDCILPEFVGSRGTNERLICVRAQLYLDNN